MADVMVINGTDAELTNVNAGGSDVAARTISAAVTLTNAEVFAILDGAGDNSIGHFVGVLFVIVASIAHPVVEIHAMGLLYDVRRLMCGGVKVRRRCERDRIAGRIGGRTDVVARLTRLATHVRLHT